MLNKQLGLRIIFGILLLAIGYILIQWTPNWLLGIFFVAIVIGLSWEYSSLLKRIKIPINTWLTLPITLASLGAILILDLKSSLLYILLILPGVWLFIIWCLLLLRRQSRILIFYALNYYWLVIPPLFLFLLHDEQSANYLLFFLIICTASSDSVAFFSGKLFGKKKLLPAISPNKTVAGSIGAILGCFMISFLLNQYWHLFKPLEAALVGAGISVLTQIGDLAESYLKRKTGAKDSGSIIPGHGGLLDRFDGLLISTIGFYCYLLVI